MEKESDGWTKMGVEVYLEGKRILHILSVLFCFFKSVLEGIWGLTLVKFISLTNLMFKCY